MEKIGVFGTGIVGNTIATKMIQLGYKVMMGSRTTANEKAAAWATANGQNASTGTFGDAALFGDVIFNCTKGDAVLQICQLAGIDNFDGKIIVDISNPLDFSKGMPASLIPQYTNTNSLAEEIQKLLPGANVVKTLNTVNCEVMVNPKKSGGDPTMFVSGNNSDQTIGSIRLDRYYRSRRYYNCERNRNAFANMVRNLHGYRQWILWV